MARKLRHDFLGFLYASRIPNLFIIGATQYFSAIFLVGDFQDKHNQVFGLEFLLLVVSTVCIAAGGYIINDYYDQKIDMINRPERVIVGVRFRRRLAMLSHLMLTFVGIIIGFYLDVKVGAVHVFSSFLLWYYSNYLRRITLLGNLVISGLTGLTLLIVAVYFHRHEILLYVYAAFSMSIVLIREIIKDIEAVKGDAAFGSESIPVIFGVRGAKLFIYFICVGSSALLVSFLWTVENWLVRYYFIGLIPIFGWFIYRLIIADQKKDYKILIQATNVIIVTGIVSMILIQSWK
ncbi:MAG: geranylgeranylglycerol-phosphate geranylgeranyltransferase [Cyclobacteriaceae bacterium]